MLFSRILARTLSSGDRTLLRSALDMVRDLSVSSGHRWMAASRRSPDVSLLKVEGEREREEH